MWFFCTLTPPFMANANFKVSVLEKSIRETVPTFRVELIVSTFPVSPIFSVSPTYTYTITYIYLQSKRLTYVFYLQNTYLYLPVFNQTFLNILAPFQLIKLAVLKHLMWFILLFFLNETFFFFSIFKF